MRSPLLIRLLLSLLLITLPMQGIGAVLAGMGTAALPDVQHHAPASAEGHGMHHPQAASDTHCHGVMPAQAPAQDADPQDHEPGCTHACCVADLASAFPRLTLPLPPAPLRAEPLQSSLSFIPEQPAQPPRG